MKSQPVAEGHADPARRARRRVRSAGSEGPVFVDSSGRRARLFRRVGVVAGIASVGYATVLAVAIMGGTPFAPETLIPGSSATSKESEQSNKGRSHKGNSGSATPSLGPSTATNGAAVTAPTARPSPSVEKPTATASGRASSSAKATATATTTTSRHTSGPSGTSSASSSASSWEPPKATPSASASPSPTTTDTPEDGATSEPGAVG
ncbi:hypothetical protein ACFV2X_38660 [Streptomyces sp. NPDC059679]|uniref:hypothetical protein n=1 Tax=Streptomyces sp. NPDC059679 TaxID=3346903 RepID=UPI00369483C4